MAGTQRKYELKARADRLADTRQRLVAAAAALHVEVGPARTTVSEIARRAGVRRATVYNHFPEEVELFAACGDLSLSRNPPPDAAAVLHVEDPTDRLRVALTAFYTWYRKAARGMENLQRDRHLVPGLDTAMSSRVDRPLAGLVDALASGLAPGDREVHAMVALALDFWTWRRLASEGLSDEDAAALMVNGTAAAGGPRLVPASRD